MTAFAWIRRIASRPSEVGPVDEDLPVEAAGPEQGGIENVGPVRRREDDEAARRVEAVHLDEELVEGLLPLVVAAHRAWRRGSSRSRRARL